MLLGGHPVSVVYSFSQFFCSSKHRMFRLVFFFGSCWFLLASLKIADFNTLFPAGVF